MKINSEKGITNIDITISIIIITLFVSLIATLMTNITNNTKETKRRAEAMNIAINEIEKVKSVNFEESDSLKTDGENVQGKEGYYKKISIEDYADLPQNAGKTVEKGLVKKVTVEISYKQNKDIKKFDLSTVIVKN